MYYVLSECLGGQDSNIFCSRPGCRDRGQKGLYVTTDHNLVNKYFMIRFCHLYFCILYLAEAFAGRVFFSRAACVRTRTSLIRKILFYAFFFGSNCRTLNISQKPFFIGNAKGLLPNGRRSVPVRKVIAMTILPRWGVGSVNLHQYDPFPLVYPED